MLDKFIIKGRNKIEGEIETRGSKNAAFPILSACFLTDKPCYIKNIPLIEDVLRMLEIMKSVGAEIDWVGEREIRVKCVNVNPRIFPKHKIGLLRGSVVLLGSFIARFGKVDFPMPGGDRIGVRPIDTHLDAFLQQKIKVLVHKGHFYFEGKPKPAKVILKEFSVTATENIILSSALTPGKTFLKIADQDYSVQELIKVLSQMGVKIRQGIHSFIIEGKSKLDGFKINIIPDPLEAGTFITMALATKGKVLVKGVEFDFLELFLKRLRDFGANFKITRKKEILVLPSLLKMDKIQSLPYPGIPTDLQPELGVLATQSKGLTLLHDPLYESRLKYLEELNKMGANIIFCDPHRAIIKGPTRLYGKEIPSLDIRSGAAFIIAGLVAYGETIINDIHQIDRGYERIEERLQKLGVNIRRIKEQK